MNDTSAELMYAMMFGDRSSLDNEIRETFSATGLAHVLAVSGLHVMLIMGIVVAILKLFRVPKKYQLILVILLLCFYTYLADFRYTIMRASIMFILLFINSLFLRRGDFLSAISFAAIIILILFPHALWSASFQLSFACMYGIALFSRPVGQGLERITPFAKVKWLKGFRKGYIKGINLYTTTAITTFPFLIYYFGNFPAIGLFANVLLLPFIILAFQMSVIALFTWVGFPLLWVVDWIVIVCLRIADWFASIDFLRLYISTTGAWYLFYFVGLVFLSRFVFMKRLHKYIVASLLFSVYLVSILIQNS